MSKSKDIFEPVLPEIKDLISSLAFKLKDKDNPLGALVNNYSVEWILDNGLSIKLSVSKYTLEQLKRVLETIHIFI